MTETTLQAIVLRRRDAGESDRRLTVLTAERGKIDVIAKGARKAASRLAGISDPLCVGQLSIAQGKMAMFITQAQPMRSFPGLREDYDKLNYGIALAELYAAVLPVNEPFPEAYDLLVFSLRHLEVHPKPLAVLLWAEIQLLAISGFMPQFGRCVVTDAAISEADPFLSPMAGGYVSDAAAHAFSDRFRTRAEVLYGLARLPDLETPPPNFRFGPEALGDLLAFWRAIAEIPLPANEMMVKEVRHLTVSRVD